MNAAAAFAAACPQPAGAGPFYCTETLEQLIDDVAWSERSHFADGNEYRTAFNRGVESLAEALIAELARRAER